MALEVLSIELVNRLDIALHKRYIFIFCQGPRIPLNRSKLFGRDLVTFAKVLMDIVIKNIVKHLHGGIWAHKLVKVICGPSDIFEVLKDSVVLRRVRAVVHRSYPWIKGSDLSKPILLVFVKFFDLVAGKRCLLLGIIKGFEGYLKEVVSKVPTVDIRVLHYSLHLVQSHVRFHEVRLVSQLMPNAQTPVIQS